MVPKSFPTKLVITATCIASAVLVWIFLSENGYLNIETLINNSSKIEDAIAANPINAAIIAFFAYTLFAAACLPGLSILTLGTGVFFGLKLGITISSFASTIGATISFLIARYLMRDIVELKFRSTLPAMNRELNKNGALYILLARLVPIFPFTVINLTLGITRTKLRDFYVYSQLGMLPITAIIVNAGSNMQKIERPEDIFSASVVTALLLLASIPILIRLYIGHRKNSSP